MLVVSDTSPLNYLILIEAIDVLPRLFERVVTAHAVLAELGHPGAPQPVRSWASIPPVWIEVLRPSQPHADLGLGRGESEAISLALELKADLVLFDERAATQAARRLSIETTGTLGVLDLAARRGLIALPDAIERLKRTTFRVNPRLLDHLLDRHGKRSGGR